MSERKSPPVCPRCGGPLVPIVYGYPGPKLSERARQGEIQLGGCVVWEDAPEWACSECRREFTEGIFDE